jgi:transcriptional regulator with XRE-family HTH domain
MPDKYKQQRQKVTPPHVGLADLRKSHRLTQAGVAQQIEAITGEPFYSGSLSLIEGGHRGASEPVLRALEQIFGIELGAMRTDYTPSHARRKTEEPAA